MQNGPDNDWEYQKATACLLLSKSYLMLCAIWHHLYNFKNVKNIHGGVLLLDQLEKSFFQKSTCSIPN